MYRLNCIIFKFVEAMFSLQSILRFWDYRFYDLVLTPNCNIWFVVTTKIGPHIKTNIIDPFA